MVKDVTKFHKRHLGGGGGGGGNGVCLNVWSRVLYRSLSFRRGRTPKLGGGELQNSVLEWSGCISQN